MTRVEKGKVYWENYEGEQGQTEYDFAMLIPQFQGTPIKYIDQYGNDITSKLTNLAGFLKVDGNWESMAEMPGACIASIGKSVWNGSAASIVMYPVVPDFEHYPDYGRDLSVNEMEVGLAGAMQLIRTMKPTKRTLFMRQCKIFQLCAFIYLNVKILKTALFPPHK
ncbi:hypothetical protein [Ferviditalea candida]|uniref:Uncharacterized protein n=1 Tax=Ferviditalea candida TaxID=3108399 RepID=A0ABU5ZFN7_9BACL|nr:hypothetical protein [Paenibacillaceae bacterium T2]